MVKVLILVVLMVQLSAAQTFSSEIGTLQRAEKLTDSEKATLAEADVKLAKAQAEHDKSVGAIAAAHNMANESYMEWSRWYVIDGDWILQRFHSYQNYGILTPLTNSK